MLLDKAVARSHKEIRVSGLNVLINEHSRSGFSVFSRQPCFPDADAASRFLTSGYIRWKWLNHTGKLRFNRIEVDRCITHLREEFGKLRIFEQKGSQLRAPDWAPYPII